MAIRTTKGDAARPLTKKMVTVVAASFALAAMTPTAAYASVATTPDQPMVKVGAGGVHAFATDGADRAYIGGLFSAVGGQSRTNVAAISADGTLDPGFNPGTNGKVLAVALSDDGGTVYLGGEFTEVGGVPRTGLAAVDASTGAVLENWVADTTGTSFAVRSLAVHGNRLYAAGGFAKIDGAGRPKLAALNADTGDVDLGFKPRPKGGLREVVVSPFDGNVYVGGALTALSLQPREAVGAVEPDTGAPTPFAPTAGDGNAVTVDVGPDGDFYYSTENNMLLAYNTNAVDTGAVDDLAWSIKTSGNTQAIEVVNDEMWIGGHFSQIVSPEKIARPFLASLDPTDGSVNAWDSACTGGKQGVWELYHDGDDLHAGGYFAAFHGVKQRGYARFTEAP